MTIFKREFTSKLHPTLTLLAAALSSSVIAGDYTMPNMVNIPGGNFMMGTAFGDKRAQPLHPVSVAPFMMAKHKVTMAEFRQFIEDTNYQAPQDCKDTLTENWLSSPEDIGDKNWQNHRYVVSEYQPVSCITWHDANAYIDWLNNKTGKVFRLPTEQEWEYATRANTTSRFFWGDDPNLTQACQYGNFADESSEYWASEKVGASYVGFLGHANCDDNEPFITVVGLYRANPFGLHDMVGNVSQHLANCYYPEYKNRSDEEMDTKTCERIAHRGYSWHSPPVSHSDRGRYNPRFSPGAGMGFRLVSSDLSIQPDKTTAAFNLKLKKAQKARVENRPVITSKPTNVQLNLIKEGHYTLSWQQSNDERVTHYEVYQSTMPHSHLMAGFFKKHYKKIATVNANESDYKVNLPKEGGSFRIVAKANKLGSLPSDAVFQTPSKQVSIPGTINMQHVESLFNAKLGHLAANETRSELYYMTKLNNGYRQDETKATFKVFVKETGWYKVAYRARTRNEGVFYKVWQDDKHVGDIVYGGDKSDPQRNRVYLKKGLSNLEFIFMRPGMDFWSMGGVELTKIDNADTKL